MPSTPARTDGRRLTVRPYHCRPRIRRPSSGQHRTHSSFALIRVRGGGSHSCRPCSAPRRGGGSGHGCPSWPPHCSCSPLSPGRRSPVTGRAGCGTPSSRRASPGPRPRSGSPLPTSTGAARPRSRSPLEIDGRPRSMVVAGVGSAGRSRPVVRRPRPAGRSESIGSRSPPGRPTGRASASPAGLVRVVKTGSSGSGSGSTSGGTSSGTERGGRLRFRRDEARRRRRGHRIGQRVGHGSGAAGSGQSGRVPSVRWRLDRPWPGGPARHLPRPVPARVRTRPAARWHPAAPVTARRPAGSTASPTSPSNEATPADGAPVEPPGLRGERADASLSAAEPAGPQPAGSVDSTDGTGLPDVRPGDGPEDAEAPGRDGGAAAGGSGRIAGRGGAGCARPAGRRRICPTSCSGRRRSWSRPADRRSSGRRS